VKTTWGAHGAVVNAAPRRRTSRGHFNVINVRCRVFHATQMLGGRVSLMGLQAGLPPLDLGGIRGAKRRSYIAAVHSAIDRNYAPMTEVFLEVIQRTLRSAARTSSD
jgi:hypothetical protein